MRPATFFIAFLFPCALCFAELSDDTLAQAKAHYESMIYATVAERIAEDIEAAQLTKDEDSKWLGVIVSELASCHLDALAYLGESIRVEAIRAFATGAGNQEISLIISKHMKAESNFQATLAAYSEVREQCTVLVNQEFGINYF